MRKLTHSLPDHQCTQTTALTGKKSIVVFILRDIILYFYIYSGYIAYLIFYWQMEKMQKLVDK